MPRLKLRVTRAFWRAGSELAGLKGSGRKDMVMVIVKYRVGMVNRIGMFMAYVWSYAMASEVRAILAGAGRLDAGP